MPEVPKNSSAAARPFHVDYYQLVILCLRVRNVSVDDRFNAEKNNLYRFLPRIFRNVFFGPTVALY